MAQRSEHPAQNSSQAFADRVHSQLVQTNRFYAVSVQAGQTLRWANPYQDLNSSGTPINTLWYINVKDRCFPVLSTTEVSNLKTF